MFESRSRVCQGLSDYLQTLEAACERNRIESLGIKVAEWFEPIFKVVELLTPAAAVAVQAYPNPGSLVLGGIVGVLQTANRVVQYQKLTVQTLARMGAKARVLFEHEGYLYAEDKGVQTTLLEIYGDILDFCTAAFRLVENKKGSLLAQTRGLSRLLTSDWDSRLGGIVMQFDQHMDVLKDRIAARNSAWLKEVRDKQDAAHERSEAARGEVRKSLQRSEEFARVWKKEQDHREREYGPISASVSYKLSLNQIKGRNERRKTRKRSCSPGSAPTAFILRMSRRVTSSWTARVDGY